MIASIDKARRQLADHERLVNRTIGEKDAEIEKLRAALQSCVDAHDTGKFEPAQAAYHNAVNVLEDTSDNAGDDDG